MLFNVFDLPRTIRAYNLSHPSQRILESETFGLSIFSPERQAFMKFRFHLYENPHIEIESHPSVKTYQTILQTLQKNKTLFYNATHENDDCTTVIRAFEYLRLIEANVWHDKAILNNAGKRLFKKIPPRIYVEMSDYFDSQLEIVKKQFTKLTRFCWYDTEKYPLTFKAQMALQFGVRNNIPNKPKFPRFLFPGHTLRYEWFNTFGDVACLEKYFKKSPMLTESQSLYVLSIIKKEKAYCETSLKRFNTGWRKWFHQETITFLQKIHTVLIHKEKAFQEIYAQRKLSQQELFQKNNTTTQQSADSQNCLMPHHFQERVESLDQKILKYLFSVKMFNFTDETKRYWMLRRHEMLTSRVMSVADLPDFSVSDEVFFGIEKEWFEQRPRGPRQLIGFLINFTVSMMNDVKKLAECQDPVLIQQSISSLKRQWQEALTGIRIKALDEVFVNHWACSPEERSVGADENQVGFGASLTKTESAKNIKIHKNI